jgi:hypothetical protein
MRRLATTIGLVIALAMISQIAEARPKKGFHTGPYLTFEIGAIGSDFDRDQVTNERVGNDIEPAFGFLFGWNVTDAISAELQGLYATSRTSGKREHLASAGAYCKWTFITDALTDFKSLRILPFAKGGMMVRAASLPGGPSSPVNVMSTIGFGPSAGVGVAFLWHKYFYFGVDIQGDFLLFDDQHQTVNGVPNTLVYKGGFYPSVSTLAIIGVHY